MATEANFEIARAGWVHRQTSVLKRWKRCWLVLTTDGVLRYFESPDNLKPEDTIYIGARVSRVLAGRLVTSRDPPPDRTSDCYIQLLAYDNSEILAICAESPDDGMAWLIALEQARATHAPQLSPSRQLPQYPHQSYREGTRIPEYYTSYITEDGQQIYYSPVMYNGQQPQVIHVIREPRPGYYDNGYYGAGTGLAMGAVTGMMLGSMMFHPFGFWGCW